MDASSSVMIQFARSPTHSISHSSCTVMTLKRVSEEAFIDKSFFKKEQIHEGRREVAVLPLLPVCMCWEGEGKRNTKCEPKYFCLRGRIVRRICEVNIQCNRKVRRNGAVCLPAENSELGDKIAVRCGFTRAYGVLTELNGEVYAPYSSFL